MYVNVCVHTRACVCVRVRVHACVCNIIFTILILLSYQPYQQTITSGQEETLQGYEGSP